MSFWAHHGLPGAETLLKAYADFMSFWAQHGHPGAETLVKALAVFMSFWARHMPLREVENKLHLWFCVFGEVP